MYVLQLDYFQHVTTLAWSYILKEWLLGKQMPVNNITQDPAAISQFRKCFYDNG